MDFIFKDSTQADDLIAQLHLGQIIKVSVLEKTNNSQYLISYKNIQLTAVSEVDLFTKSVWLKVTQKSPFPKFQIIIEDKNSHLKGLFEYASDNDLIIPFIPEGIKSILTHSTTPTDSQVLFDFISWYSERMVWSVLNDDVLAQLIINGITYDEILISFREIVLTCNENKEHKIKLLNSLNDIKNLEIDIAKKLTPYIAVLEKINFILESKGTFLSLLFIDHPLFNVLMPLESIVLISGFIMMSMLKTKHFGKIYIKYEIFNQKYNIKLLFESKLYINNLNDDLINCIVDKNTTLNLILQTTQNIQSITQNKYDNNIKNEIFTINEDQINTLANVIITIRKKDKYLED